MQTNDAMHHHTAHQLGLVRFAYRFHPFFGQDIRVIRRLRTGEPTSVIVQGEEDLRIVVPCWMLDECFCQGMVLEERARISVEALVRLRGVIDAQGLCAGRGGEGFGSLVANEDSNESSTDERAKDRCPAVDSATGGA